MTQEQINYMKEKTDQPKKKRHSRKNNYGRISYRASYDFKCLCSRSK